MIWRGRGSSRRRHTRSLCDWSSDVCSSDLREALQSTGVGDGIAIPHVRNPIVLHVSRPMITLCFLERPIDFGALDGKPVHVLFSLISPTVRRSEERRVGKGDDLEGPRLKQKTAYEITV